MTLAYIVIVTLALLPQVAFSFLYWKWVPSWIRNPYGRLAQLDSFSQILVLFIFLIFLFVGTLIGHETKRFVMAVLLVPFIFLGWLRLVLLKRAVDSSKDEEDKETKRT